MLGRLGHDALGPAAVVAMAAVVLLQEVSLLQLSQHPAATRTCARIRTLNVKDACCWHSVKWLAAGLLLFLRRLCTSSSCVGRRGAGWERSVQRPFALLLFATAMGYDLAVGVMYMVVALEACAAKLGTET